MSLSERDKELIVNLVKLVSDLAVLAPLLLRRVANMSDPEVKLAISEARLKAKHLQERLDEIEAAQNQ